jgi:ribosomal protein L16 Arg81 hydroxylase
MDHLKQTDKAADSGRLLTRMMGGDEDRFFRQYWRKRTLFSKSCCAEFRRLYDSNQFLEDCQRSHCGEALLTVSVNSGRRTLRSSAEPHTVLNALQDGLSVVLQSLLVPNSTPNLPQPWIVFRSLHRALAEYLLPDFPLDTTYGGPISAVDFFCSLSESSTGGHYDTGDVFYFVLEGAREWTVEREPNLEKGIAFALERADHDLEPTADCDVFCVRPGDCLYVPPYTYHRVRSTGTALAVSLGLPTFGEVHLLLHLFADIRKPGYLYQPLPTFPLTQPLLLAMARAERRAMRSRTVHEINTRLLDQL